MEIRALASSSNGNAYLVRQEKAALLIDDGLSYRELVRRGGEEIGLVTAVLVTHAHGDHIAGLAALLKRHPRLTIYANEMTADSIVAQTGIGEKSFLCFENGQTFEVGPFQVHPFSIPHDTSDPVGYLIRGDLTYFHGTDIGSPLDSVGVQLAEADVATLESNHDDEMLRCSGRPPSVIQRIAGPRGHLSNDEAAELVRRHASPRLRELRLAHLSLDCNLPYLAERTMRSALGEIGRSEVTVKVLSP